ncbi:hypothetical protein JCM14036_18320 [Desulfotomaculum defluvii]
MVFVRHSHKRRSSRNNKPKDSTDSDNGNKSEDLSKDISSNIEMLKQMMGYASDLMVREFTIDSVIEIKAAVMTISGLSARNLINDHLLATLMHDIRFNDISSSQVFFEKIKQYGISNVQVHEEVSVKNIAHELISGNTVLFLDGIYKALIVGS